MTHLKLIVGLLALPGLLVAGGLLAALVLLGICGCAVMQAAVDCVDGAADLLDAMVRGRRRA